jgi:hypothetical protein
MVNPNMASEDEEPKERDAPEQPPKSVTWERSFFAALRAMRHLYFKLEKAGLELDSGCHGCHEIRNFLNMPGYRGDLDNPLGVDMHRPENYVPIVD